MSPLQAGRQVTNLIEARALDGRTVCKQPGVDEEQRRREKSQNPRRLAWPRCSCTH